MSTKLLQGLCVEAIWQAKQNFNELLLSQLVSKDFETKGPWYVQLRGSTCLIYLELTRHCWRGTMRGAAEVSR